MSDALVRWLLQAETYAERPGGVTLVETHISWVFLTDRFAYKLKKPVRFEFVDYSSVELRRRACEDEVRLNRRLAPDVYLGIVAVRRDSRGKLSLDEESSCPLAWPLSATNNGGADVVDWLVKMRRLPADRTLVELHRSNRLTDADLVRLARRLTEFDRHATPSALDPSAFRDEIERHVRANRAELLASSSRIGIDVDPLPSATIVKRVHAAQLQMLQLRPSCFDARVTAGRVIDGHGDLRPEHIYFLPEPVVIDCIEFSPEFRELDVADELSFLTTECDFIDAAAAGRRIADECLNRLGDRPPAELLAFYRGYRACVRAKVAMLRSRQMDGNQGRSKRIQAVRHVELADRYADELLSAQRPLMLVVHGLTGSGKSTLAKALADRFGAELLVTDAVRRQLFGSSSAPAVYNQAIYRPQSRMAVYEALLTAAGLHLKESIPVVLDGTFLRNSLRYEAAQVAARSRARLLMVHCCCPEDVALERIVKRLATGSSLSEARPELYAQQLAEEEPSPPDLESIDVDTTAPLDAQLAELLRNLKAIE